MNKADFYKWLKDYHSRCWAGVQTFVKDHDCEEIWFEDLEGTDFEDAIEANKQLRGNDCPKFESVPVAVANAAFSIKRAKISGDAKESPENDTEAARNAAQLDSPQESKPKYIGNERTFRCQHCKDTGMVGIVSHKTVKEAIEQIDQGNDPPKHFPVSYSELYCSCRIGDVKRADFAGQKAGNRGDRDSVFHSLPVYGQSNFHIHQDLILDRMVCSTRFCKSKTLADWKLVGSSELHCTGCKAVHTMDDVFKEPRSMTVVLEVHKRMSAPPINASRELLDYTKQAIGS